MPMPLRTRAPPQAVVARAVAVTAALFDASRPDPSRFLDTHEIDRGEVRRRLDLDFVLGIIGLHAAHRAQTVRLGKPKLDLLARARQPSHDDLDGGVLHAGLVVLPAAALEPRRVGHIVYGLRRVELPRALVIQIQLAARATLSQVVVTPLPLGITSAARVQIGPAREDHSDRVAGLNMHRGHKRQSDFRDLRHGVGLSSRRVDRREERRRAAGTPGELRVGEIARGVDRIGKVDLVPILHRDRGVGRVGPDREVGMLSRHAAVGLDIIETVEHHRLIGLPYNLGLGGQCEQ
mmetsp:Transcript_108483/g.315483  ORF Transcript_108483/g.315483 Transcript_108483/m.315483 type:complete len:292 (+) Transcript_108483:509-1384(+)